MNPLHHFFGCRLWGRTSAPLIYAAVLLLAVPANAQVTPYLQVESIELGATVPTELIYRDHGTGATSYQIEYISALNSGEEWSEVPEATITDLGDGSYRAVLSDPAVAQGYYRISGLDGTVPIVSVNFANPTLQAAEGDTVNPLLVFGASFFGTIRYKVTGTLGEDDTSTLSGELQVNGQTEATIPITLLDNSHIGALEYLTLHLELGEGYVIEGLRNTTINKFENDQEWSGSFDFGGAALGFLFSVFQSEAGQLVGFQSDEFGFFPDENVSGLVTLTGNTFEALIQNVQIPAEATLFNISGEQTVELTADNANADQLVDADQIFGAARLITRYPASPHLDTTNSGTFVLISTPARPSTKQTELSPAP